MGGLTYITVTHGPLFKRLTSTERRLILFTREALRIEPLEWKIFVNNGTAEVNTRSICGKASIKNYISLGGFALTLSWLNQTLTSLSTLLSVEIPCNFLI